MMKSWRWWQVMAVAVVFCILALLASLLRTEIELWINEQNGWVKIYSRDKIILPGVSVDDYDRVVISRHVNNHHEVISRDLKSLPSECQSCVTNWLAGEHKNAMRSFADYVPDIQICLFPKKKADEHLLLVTIVDGFSVTYDYGNRQYLRLETTKDHRFIEMIKTGLVE